MLMQAVGDVSVELGDMRVAELSAQLAAMTAERDAAMGELHDTAAALVAAHDTIASLQAQLQAPVSSSKSSRRMPNTPLAVTAAKAAMAAKAAKSASPAVAVTPAAATRMAQATGETPLLLPSFGMGMTVDYNATLSWSPMGAALDGEASPACRPMSRNGTPAMGREAPRRRSTEAKAAFPSAAKDAAKRKTAEEAGTPAPTPGRRKTRRTAPDTPTEEQVEPQAKEMVEAEEAMEEVVEEAEAAPVEEVKAVSEETVAEAAEAAEAEKEEEEDSCSVCNKANGTLLLCDGCDTAFHLKCLKPVLRKIPKGDWFCATCKKAAKEAKEPVEEKEQVEAAPVAPAQSKLNGRGCGRQAAVESEPVSAAAPMVRRSRAAVIAAEPIAEEEESTWMASDEPDLMPHVETTELKAAGKGNKRRMSWAPDNVLEKVRHFRKENAPAAAAQEIAPKLSAVVEPAPKRGRKAAAVEPTAAPARRTTRARK